MKISDIEFKDNAFKKAILATKAEDTESVIEIRARKSGIECLNLMRFILMKLSLSHASALL